MTDVEVLTDLLGEFVKDVRSQIAEMPEEDLAWRPDPGANSIGVTVWHVARWMDVFGARILQDLPADQEQWHTQGWAEKTGYDPRGIGARGLGVITGYTLEEAAAVPRLSAGELLAYLAQAHRIVDEQLHAMPAEALYQPVPGQVVQGTVYGWTKTLLKGFFGHVGEVQALKAMRERATAPRK